MIKSVKIKYDKYVAETSKAYLIIYLNTQVWLPKSLCKNFHIYGNDMHGVTEIPSFLFEKITGCDPNNTDKDLSYWHAEASWIVEKHKPEKINFTEEDTKPDATLIK